MTTLFNKRMKAQMEGEFVVFLIGMRVNKWWKIHQWLPVMLAMPKMLKELYAHPELGFISQESWVGRRTVMIQYWRSLAALESYAKSRDSEHLPEWVNFNKRIALNGDVGIWHETYLINKDSAQSVYINMPRFGAAKAGQHVELRASGQKMRI